MEVRVNNVIVNIDDPKADDPVIAATLEQLARCLAAPLKTNPFLARTIFRNLSDKLAEHAKKAVEIIKEANLRGKEE